MTSPADATNPAQRLETLIEALESSRDPSAASAREFARLLLDYHKTGLTRLFHILRSATPANSNVISQMTADPIVQSLLLIHDLHPIDLESRVHQAISQLEPLFAAQQVEVTQIALQGNRLRVSLQGLDTGDHATFRRLEQTLQTVLLEAAPDLNHVEICQAEAPLNPRYELPLVRFPSTPVGRH